MIKKLLGIRTYLRMENFKDIKKKYFLRKKGIEIGGPSPFFNKKGFMPIYGRSINLDGVNFAQSTIWTGEIDKKKGYEVNGKRMGKQFILDTVDLTSIKNNSYDFVLSCNNIEHIANPLKAVEQWLSVLKPGGIFVIVAPRKESNFDHNRDIVDFEHLLKDYQNQTAEDDLTHLEEIITLHDLEMDKPAGTPEQFKNRSLKNYENRCLHHHVFDLEVLNKVVTHFKLSIIRKAQIDTDYVIIGQK